MNKTKKFIYLISPNKIQNNFFNKLNLVFKLNKISFFQLRLKKNTTKQKLNFAKKVKKICKKHNVKLIINDNPNLAKKIGANGCHLGQTDTPLVQARKLLNNKIIGITCHNSKKLIKKAANEGADYVALGAFFKSKTKKTKFKAKLNLLKWAKKNIKVPIVAIGGINSKNYQKLLLNNANFLAISGYVWRNKKKTPVEALKEFV